MSESNKWENRLVSASLLEKMFDSHAFMVQAFLSYYFNKKNHWFWIKLDNNEVDYEVLEGLLLFDDNENDNKEKKKEGKLSDLKSISAEKLLTFNRIDFTELINKENPLYSCDAQVNFISIYQCIN